MSNQATSGVLELEFRNCQPISLPSFKSTASAIYQIAGDANSIPIVKIKSISFARFVDNQFYGLINYTPTNNEFPANTIRLTKGGILRQFQLYTLSLPKQYVRNVQGQKVTQELLILRSLSMSINIGHVPLHNEGFLRAAKDFSDTENANPDYLLGTQVLNPNIDYAFCAIKPNQTEWNKSLLWVETINAALMANATVLKYKIEKPGIYQFSPDSVLAKVPQEDVTTWMFFSDGEQIPTYKMVDNRLAVQIPQFDIVQEGYKTLWVICPQENMPDFAYKPKFVSPYVSAISTQSTPSLVLTDFVFEKLHGYHPRLNANSDVCRWFWKTVSDDKTSVFTFDLPKGFAPDESTTTTLTIYGQAPDPLSENATVKISLNGHYLPNKIFSSSTRTIALDLPTNILRSGDNVLTLRLHFTTQPTNKSDLLVQKLTVNCKQSLDRIREAFDSQISFSLATDCTTFSLSTKSADTLDTSALIVASLKKPYQVFAPFITTDTLNFDIGAPTKNEYCFITRNLFVPPKPTSVNRFTLFELSQGYDTIYISPLDLQQELQVLANHRMTQGWRILTVDCETIYDHFSFGNRSPQAIQSFLKWCYFNLPSPKVQNVLLVGEASDFKLLSRDSDQIPFGHDNLPVWGGPRSVDPRGDHEYSLVSGNDMIADLGVGRISVNDSDELRGVIEKLLQYENAPAASWNLNTVYTYDDNDEFPQIVTDVMNAATTPYENCIRIPQSDYYYLPNSKVTYRKRAYGATEAIIKAFNEGVGVINYFGHGAPNLWSHERMLQINDLKQLSNRNALPFITCSSCDNAWLDYPMVPVQASMGELFLKIENGGGIGIFAPVSGASPFEHKTLMSYLNDAIWHQGIQYFGNIAAYAKNMYQAHANSIALPRQYILIGDPGMKLKHPVPQQDSDKFSISPSTISADTTTSIKVSCNLKTNHPFHLRISSDEGNTIKDIVIPKAEPNYCFDLTVPPLPAGKHGISLLQTLPSGEISEFLIAPLVADNLFVHFYTDTKDTYAKPICLNEGEESSVTLCITNCSNLPLNDGILQVSITPSDNSDRIIPIGQTSISVAGNETIKVTVPIKETAKQYIAYLALPEASVTPHSSIRIPVYKKNELKKPDIHILPTPEYTTISPEAPESTFNIRLKASFVNTGDVPLTSASVQVCLDSSIVCSSQTVQTILPYDVGNAFLALTTPLPEGKHELDIVFLSDEDATTIATCKLPVTVLPQSTPYFVNGSIRLWSQSGQNTEQETMFVSARVRNNGANPIKNIPICVVKDNPLTGEVQKSINDVNQLTIRTIEPNETENFVFRWENYSWRDESQNFYLVLNKNSQKNSELAKDSWTTLPFVRSTNLGDFAIDSCELSNYVVRPNTPITIKAAFSYNGNRPQNNISVQYGLVSNDGDAQMKNYVINSITKDNPESFIKTLSVTNGHPLVKIDINANREISESNPTNNSRVIPVSLLYKENELEQTEANTYSLKKLFDSFVLESIEYIPELGFSLLDKFTSSTGIIEVQQKYVVSDNIETSAALYHYDKEDELWLVLPWLARAWPNENAEELAFKIPMGEDNDSLFYEAKVLVSAGMNYEGMPVGSLQAKLSSDDNFSRYDPPNLSPTTQDSWISLGRTKLFDGCFTPVFKQVGDASAVIKAFELIPMQAILQTPAIEFDHDCTMTLSIQQDFYAGKIALQFRTGHLLPNDSVVWSQWSSTDVEHPSKITKDNPVAQWRIIIEPTTQNRQGTVKDIMLKELVTE